MIKNIISILKTILGKKFKHWIISQILISLGNTVFVLSTAFLVQTVFKSFEIKETKLLFYATIVLLGGLLLSSVLTFYGKLLIKKSINISLVPIKEKLFSFILDNKNISNNGLFYLNDDIKNISSFILENMIDIITAMITGIISFIFILTQNIYIGIILLAFLIGSLLNQYNYLKKQDKINLDLRTSENKVYDSLKTCINSQEIIRSYNKKEYFLSKFSNTLNLKRKSEITNFLAIYKYQILNFIFEYGGTAFPFIVVFLFTLLNKIPLSTAIFILQISGNMMFFCNKFVPASLGYKKMKLSYEKIYNFITNNTIQFEKKKTFKKMPIKIQIDDLSINYNNINIVNVKNAILQENKVTLLLGPSGTGKTSVLKSILKLIEYQGNIDIYGSGELLETSTNTDSLNFMPQNNLLFNESILENIRLGNAYISFEDVKNLAIKLGANDFIEDLPNGYDTIFGLEGTSFSGGQIQKILLIRTLLNPSNVLLLDEPNAYFDVVTKKVFSDIISEIKKDKSIIIVTHDYDLVEYSDYIIYINNGTVEWYGEENDKHSLSHKIYLQNCTMGKYSSYK